MNETISFDYTSANVTNTRYYWKVYANDGHDNVSKEFYFNTFAYLTKLTSGSDASSYDYLILTTDAFYESTEGEFYRYDLEDLGEFHYKEHGLDCAIINVSTITSDSTYWDTGNAVFNDSQAKIRDFLVTECKGNVDYLFIVGNVPMRQIYFPEVHVGATYGDEYCEFPQYYAYLDGDWYNDGDWNYNFTGTENVDYDTTNDISVGRINTASMDDVCNYIEKLLYWNYTLYNDPHHFDNWRLNSRIWTTSDRANFAKEKVASGSYNPFTGYTTDYIYGLYERDIVLNYWSTGFDVTQYRYPSLLGYPWNYSYMDKDGTQYAFIIEYGHGNYDE